MFEFLDERQPATFAIPPAPIVAAAPVVAPTVERREPSGYTAPVFFPFGKPEPTAPQLKLSGVSSFKKINRSEARILLGLWVCLDSLLLSTARTVCKGELRCRVDKTSVCRNSDWSAFRRRRKHL